MEFKPEADPFGTRAPFTINLRIKYILTGVLLPAINIYGGLTGASANGMSQWQSGSNDAYILLFLQLPGLICFLPLLLLSMAALFAVVFKQSNIKFLWVRLGLYTGAILSIQFLVAVILVTSPFIVLVGGIVAPCVAFALLVVATLLKGWSRFTIRHLLIATTVLAVLLAALLAIPEPLPIMASLYFVMILMFIAGPTLCCVTYCRLAYFAGLFEKDRNRSPRGITGLICGLIVWLIAFFIAWRISIQRVLDEYQYLPTTSPNCYVASAAAYGNPKLVKSRCVASGNDFALINIQMQRLKFLELAFRAIAPRTHRQLRNIYDRIGPPMARQCKRSQTMANVAFVLLKPIELFAEAFRLLARIPRESIEQLYIMRFRKHS